MKSALLLFNFLIISSSLYSQCPIPDADKLQNGNGISANILNSGDLFWDRNDPGFIVNEDLPTQNSPIYAAALWMGGFDIAGNLKLAAQTYGSASGANDYFSGPLSDIGMQDEDLCEDYNRVWRVTGENIQQHKLDFADNGIIDNPLETIYQWPGKANPHFFENNGFALPDMTSDWAPFFDVDNNGTYNPANGDYPHPPNAIPSVIPASINWTVFNDSGIHTSSGGDNINMEVQLSSWSFNCLEENILNYTVFTSHKLVYHGIEPLDSFHIGIWADPDLGCYFDDYIGCDSTKGVFYIYESDNDPDIDCSGTNATNYRPPALSVQFLNKELSKFTYYNNGGTNPPPTPGTDDPQTGSPAQFFNYLSGSWRDGTRLTYGGTGYGPFGNFISHAFTDNPNDVNGWSMYQENLSEGDRRVLGSYFHDFIVPGEVIQFDVAYSYHRKDEIFDHLEIVNQVYEKVDLIKQYYDQEFENLCTKVLGTNELDNESIDVFPNPSNGIFNLNTSGLEVNAISLVDISGRMVYADKTVFNDFTELNFSHLAKGIYFLNVQTEKGIITKKIIIQ